MSGKTLLILLLLVLAGAAVAVAVVTQSGAPTEIGSGRPGGVTKPDDEEIAELPPLRDRPAITTGEVAGRVLGPDGQPIAGATVTLTMERDGEPGSRNFGMRMGGSGMSASFGIDPATGPEQVGILTTGDDGSFVFTTGKTGPFTVRADLTGFGSALKAEVKRGTRDLVLHLAAAGSLSGLVQDDLGTALPGAVVIAGLASTLADETGRFLLQDVAADSDVKLLARANGYDNAELELALAPGEEKTLEDPLVLQGKPGLTGRVFTPEGNPLKDALASVTTNLLAMTADSTDEGGRYYLETPGEGTVGLSIRHLEYLEEEVEGLHFRKGERVVAPDVRLRPGGVIAGRVVGPDGQPVSGAKTVAMLAQSEFDIANLMMMGMTEEKLPSSDDDGNFRVPGLATGTYLLAVSAEGYRPFLKKEIAVQVPETTTVDVALDAGLSLRGKVIDGDGKPLAGAKISASVDEEQVTPENMQEAILVGDWSAEAETAEDGSFVLAGLGESKVHLSVKKAGYSQEFVNDVEPGTDELVVTLRLTGSVSGRVVDGETGDPVPGARISADDSTSGNTTTDEDGQFTLASVSPGDRTLSVNSEEHVPEEHADVAVLSGSPTTGIEISLRRGESLSGVVVRASDGGFIGGATVSVDGPVSRSGACDPDGHFTIKGLVKGVYDLKATSGDYADTTVGGVKVPFTGEVRIEMLMGGTIRGVVRDENGEPLPGQMVMSGSGPDIFGNMSTTNADGEFEFKNVPAGNQTLMVMKVQSGGGFGFGANTKSVLVKEGEEVYVEFGGAGSPKKTRLKGRLLDHGRPAGGRMLIFMRANIEGGMAELMANFKMVTTSKDGAFDVADLEPGSYRVFSGMMGADMGTSMDLEVAGDGDVLEQDLALPDGVFTGTVVRSDTGAPVAGAKLMLLDPAMIARPATSLFDILGLMKGQFTSGENGAFGIDTAAKGTMLLQVLADGLAPAVLDNVVINDKGGPAIRVVLDPGSPVTVRVIDNVGEAVAGSPVLVFDGKGRRLLVMDDNMPQTDSDGVATIILSAGTWRLLAQPRGMASTMKVVNVQGAAEVEIKVSPGGTLVTAVTAGGGPIEGAVIRTFDESGGEVAHHLTQDGMLMGAPSRKTGHDGRNTREHVPAGTYRVTATAPDGRVGAGSVRITEGGTTETTIEVK